MALYQTKSVCVISKLKCFRYSRTWFIITILNSDVIFECCELDVFVDGDR